MCNDSWEAISKGSSGNIVDFANSYCKASIPTDLWVLPEVVLNDSMSPPELDMEANPKVIEDEPALWSLDSNSIVTCVDEGWYHGEAG